MRGERRALASWSRGVGAAAGMLSRVRARTLVSGRETSTFTEWLRPSRSFASGSKPRR